MLTSEGVNDDAEEDVQQNDDHNDVKRERKSQSSKVALWVVNEALRKESISDTATVPQTLDGECARLTLSRIEVKQLSMS